MSWITDPKRRKVQLKISPMFLQCFPSNPSNTSNHFSRKLKTKISNNKNNIIEFFYPKQKNCNKLVKYLNNVITEIEFFSFFTSSILNVENTNEISSPASH